MELLRVNGGRALKGSVQVRGAKNAITKLLVASLISDKPCTFTNVPDIGDVEITVKLCQEIGMNVDWDREAGVMEVCTPELKTNYIPQRFSGANRIPILMIGALLGRTGDDIIVPTTGGCNLGKRPVDFHLQALQELGAHIEYRNMKTEGAYFAQAHQGLHGGVITLPYPSVGATENTILAAVRARGTTIIQNAAIEPEIIDIILFLQKLGANLTITADRTIVVQGTRKFYPVKHHVVPDRNVAASLGMAAVATKGRVFVEGAKQRDLLTFLNLMRDVGGGFEVRDNGIEFFYDGALRGGLHIETDVHPGFMTDWQQPFVVLLTQAKGTSVVHETVYENRFGYTETLVEMGANIELFQECLGPKECRFRSRGHYHSLIVRGPCKLRAMPISVPDLRAGFAYVMAALLVPSTTHVHGLPFLDRGYEDLAKTFQALDGDVERVKVPKQNEKNSNASKIVEAPTVQKTS